MTRTLSISRRRIPGALTRAGSAVSTILLTTACLAVATCSGDPGQPDTAEGLELVMGSALDRQGYLLVPREGGPAVLRSPLDPSERLWQGRLELPASRIAVSAGGTVVLQTPEGQVFRFDPGRESLQPLGRMPADAASFESDLGVALAGDGIALAVTDEGRTVVRPDGRVWWAGPAAGGRVVLIAGDSVSRRLEVWDAGTGAEDGELVASEPVAAGAQAHLVGRGTRLLLGDPVERALIERALPTLEEVARFDLGFAPDVISASPSAHQVYVGAASQEELAVVDRFGGEEMAARRATAGVRSVRTAGVGGALLLDTGLQVFRSDPDAEPVPLDTDWRNDLPFLLPDGRVLAVWEGELRVVWPDGEVDPLDAPADSWWVPVDWVPRRAPAGQPSPAGDRDARDAGDEQSPAVPARDTAGEMAERADRSTSGTSVPAGFHVVAGSSQEADGIEALADRLRTAGFDARVAMYDAADGVRWHRVLIGPLQDRATAEGVQARLAEWAGIEGWVLAPGPGGGR